MSNTNTAARRGRPSAFPEGVKTRMAGFNLPIETLDLLSESVTARNAARKEGAPAITQNGVVDRALRAYLRKRS